jgi:hypothetical protein
VLTMIYRFGNNLDEKQVKELASRLENRRITRFEYDIEGEDNYFVLGFDDDTKLTIFYQTGKGSLILGEGFP